MKRAIAILSISVVAFVIGALSILLTVANAGWHIREAFPGSKPHFDPVMSPDITVSSLIRTVFPIYFGFDESLGILIEDQTQGVDLNRGFALVPHKRFFSMRIRRSKIISLCKTGLPGYPSIIVFEDCDFSELPERDRTQLRVYDPQNPEKNQLCIGDV